MTDNSVSAQQPHPAGAADRWADALQAWVVPARIRAQAQVDPNFHPQWLYEHRLAQLQDLDTPSRQRALEALPEKGSVLDVGAGVGAASLPLACRLGRVVAVDENSELLRAFAEMAISSGVDYTLVKGVWPGIAPSAPIADIAVCHNVLYSVADLNSFVAAMAGNVRNRIVVELSDRHPYYYFTRLWTGIHGIDRPSGPAAEDAISVIAKGIGAPTGVDHWYRPSYWAGVPREKIVEIARIRLCLAPDMDQVISDMLDFEEMACVQRAVTMWWDLG